MDKKENDRAFRIAFTIEECHISLADIYEKLVDRDFLPAKDELINLIIELRLVIKSIDGDDF
jgi:hypothetical protein